MILLKSVKLINGILLQKGGMGGIVTVGAPMALTVIGKVELQLPSLIVTYKSGTDGELKSRQDGFGRIVPPAAGSPSYQVKVTPPPE